jgi:hypothetical protein
MIPKDSHLLFPLKNFPPQAERLDLKGMKGIYGFPLKKKADNEKTKRKKTVPAVSNAVPFGKNRTIK